MHFWQQYCDSIGDQRAYTDHRPNSELHLKAQIQVQIFNSNDQIQLYAQNSKAHWIKDTKDKRLRDHSHSHPNPNVCTIHCELNEQPCINLDFSCNLKALTIPPSESGVFPERCIHLYSKWIVNLNRFEVSGSRDQSGASHGAWCNFIGAIFLCYHFHVSIVRAGCKLNLFARACWL